MADCENEVLRTRFANMLALYSFVFAGRHVNPEKMSISMFFGHFSGWPKLPKNQAVDYLSENQVSPRVF